MATVIQKAPTPVRLPDELKAWLKEKSSENLRSLSNEIIMRLELSRKTEGSKQNADS
jgi:hypothetical protein